MTKIANTKEEWFSLVRADLNAHNKGAHPDDVMDLGEWISNIGREGQYGWFVTMNEWGEYAPTKNPR